MSKSSDSYLAWLAAGNTSEQYDRVADTLTAQWQSCSQIAAQAEVSHNWTNLCLEVLVTLGAAQMRQERQGRRRCNLFRAAS